MKQWESRWAAPHAFEDVWRPVVDRTTAELRSNLPPVDLEADALLPASTALLAQLCWWSQEILYAGFDRHRMGGRTSSTAPDATSPSHTAYRAYVEEVGATELNLARKSHPALMDSLNRLPRQWLACQQECLQRLSSDTPRLERFLDRPLGRITEVTWGLSDPHASGRTVTQLRFSDGTRLIYKPRDIDMEDAYFEFTRWTQKTDVQLRAPRILRCVGYGWAEHIAARPCRDKHELVTFYNRMGGLAAALYVLAARDAHAENLIASGDHPVLIDAECLAHPTPFNPSQPEDGLVGTQLLPLRQRRESGGHFGLGGMSATPSASARPRVRSWIDCNTDSMRPGEAAAPAPHCENLPEIEGRRVPAHEHIEDIVQGFESMWSALTADRDSLLQEDGVLQTLYQSRGRFVLRPTQVYTTALLRWRDTASQQGGESRPADSMLPPLEADRVAHPKLADAEERALRELCVPRFTIGASGRDLLLDSGDVLPNVFPNSTRERVQSRCSTLDTATRARLSAFQRSVLGLERLSRLM